MSKSVKTYENVVGVSGHVDKLELKVKLQECLILQLGSYTVGVVHGHGQSKTTIERAFHAFARDRVDCIIFDYSSIPVNGKREDIILFNPGSSKG
jgi:predicted phosphodiesterase